ncbi:serine/threonine-protein kinase [Streptomyces sp. CWNU-52B]|uniref:serine/threonine-protein kinase n=1 Tax=Streptomyces sp. CWNU-52B TaxID=3394353 RepID=UPI0039BF883A
MNCVCWYGEDIEYARPRLLTQTRLPPDPSPGRAGRAAARIVYTSEVMGLRCPGSVAGVIDVVEESGNLWTVVEWIDGMPLGEFLHQYGALDHVRAARIGLDLLDVLESAHGQGLVHGELSLGQVFARDQGGVVVTGYGLAGAVPTARIGAPAYASPEQAGGGSYGSPADLWALGALLYTMTEGRPPFRDRGHPEATLKSIGRLPVAGPRRAGPLGRIVQGLLRKDSRERLTGPVVRDALVRIVDDASATVRTAVVPPEPSAHRLAAVVGRVRDRRNLGRVTLVGAAVAAVAVTVTALAATGDSSGVDSSVSGAAASHTGPRLPTGDGGANGGANGDGGGVRTPAPGTEGSTTGSSAAPSSAPPLSPSATPTPSATGALPAGFRLYTASEGFAVALPEGWRRLSTDRAEDRSYRVVFGADGDPRNLAVTYSTRVGSDPVAVWRDTVEPTLRQADGYDRVGAIRATTYQGRRAADMEWVEESGTTRVRTFGRGFLIGGGEGFSLRWTAPDADWATAGNRQALKTFLATFRGLPD